MNPLDRREFLETAAGGLGLSLGVRGTGLPDAATQARGLFAAPALERVRVGFVGVGHQGSSHVENFLKIEGVEIRAICDIVPARVEKMQQLVTAGAGRARGVLRRPNDFRRMCETEALDLVFTATPWEWHARVRGGDEHGQARGDRGAHGRDARRVLELVELAEKAARHCVMMENCCYDRTEMMILNMVRRGLFGELLHAECGYLHDLRELKLTDFYEGDGGFSIRTAATAISTRHMGWVRWRSGST